MQLTDFISYRREDTASAAGRLYDRLRNDLENTHVFKDVVEIDLGENFQGKISAKLREANIVLVLIGKKFVTTQRGNRLMEEKDFVRFEIATSLRLKKKIIPILVNGAKMPSKEQLPTELHEFTLLQGQDIDISDKNWERDFEDLLKKLNKELDRQRPFLGFELIDENTGFYTDPRPPSETYSIFKINGKWWFTENLRTRVQTSSCYDRLPSNCKAFGRLYTWKELEEACPSGWRIPSDKEWQDLAMEFGGYRNLVSWRKFANPSLSYKKLINTGSSSTMQFSLGGCRTKRLNFKYLGKYGYYWTGTKLYKNYAWAYQFDGQLRRLYRLYSSQDKAFSVRCVHDGPQLVE